MSPAPESKTNQPNIQDVFLNYVRREKLTVTIRIMDGSELEGRIKHFDRFALVLDQGGSDRLVDPGGGGQTVRHVRLAGGGAEARGGPTGAPRAVGRRAEAWPGKDS